MIAIEDMKMPTKCAQCKFCIRQKTNDYGSYGQCMAGNCETVNTLFLSPGCPLEEIIACKDCNNHGISKEYRDIDGARYCSTLHIYTGYDFYCADAERKE